MLITADFETYYSQTYSLSKISTEAYIRSPEFEAIGVSIKIDDGPTQWYPQPQVEAALRAIDWSRAFLLAQNCVTGDHEVRTKAGWVRLDALPDGEPVLQWDPATTELSYCVPTVVRKAYDGPMLEWSTSFHRGIYTPDHRMYIQTPHVTNWQAKPASTVAALGQNNTYIPTGGQLLAGDLLDITPLEARILEFLRADGYLPANGRHATARFSKARKISRVRALLDAWGCKYAVREEPHGSKSTTFVYVHPSERLDVLRQLLGVGTSKALGPWVLSLSLPARRALLDETQYWDGYRGRGSRGNASSKQAVVVHSAKRDDIYWLTELAVLSGMSAVARYDVPNTRGWSRPDSVLHHVRIRDRERVKLVTGPTERKFSGTVYCLQVPTKAFLVRREGITWVTGNCAFDGAILTWRYGIQPKGLLDTMGMSRALFPHEKSHSLAAQAKRAGIGVKGEEVVHAIGKRYADFDEQALARYGAYCCNDVELTYALFKQYMAMGFPAQELKLIDLTLRMYTEPVLRLDGELLVQHLQEVRARKGELLATLRDHLIASGDADAVATIFTEGVEGLKKHLMSNEKFAALLRSMGVEPPTKISPTTGKEAYAFAKSDEEFLALAEDLDVRVQALVAARLGNKSTLEETRTERFIEMASRGAFAVPLRYYGAHSGRWSSADGVGLQNLPARDPKGKALKNSILPPVGHVFLDCDSAQIESRTLAWLAGQDDLVEAYRSKADVYKRMASVIYGKPVDEISKVERQVGKVVVLSCGYGVGHKKLQRFLKVQAGVEVSEAEAKRIVDTYRAANGRIVDLWRRSDAALGHLAGGAAFTVDIPGIIRVEPGKGLTLPSGLHIQYPNLRRIVTEEGKAAWVYESKGEQVYVYGGKVVENCIAGGTDVLTSRGWIHIEDVQRDDLVHDGEEFVRHGGTVFKSVQTCVTIDGVYMTPDHEVLTDDGWQAASQNPEPYRPDLRPVDCVEPGAQRRTQTVLAVPVPVRNAVHQGGGGGYPGSQTRRDTQLRVYDVHADLKGEHSAWHVQAPGVCRVAQHVGSLQAAIASGVAQLRRSWDHGMRAMAGVVREFLGGHGAYVPAGVGSKSQGQRWYVQPGKLRMGYASSERHEQAGHRASGRRSGAECTDGNRANHAVLPVSARVAGRSTDAPAVADKPVYDIINAGPRQRFVVRGESGPFIVHNCTQAVARCIVAEQMLRIARRYKVVLTVHDSVGCVAPAEEAEQAQAYVEECMRWVPAWANGLPLSCESGVGASYGAC